MDNNNVTMTDSTPSTEQPIGLHPMTTRSAACLAEKLKMLLDTPSTIENDQMECDTEDLKKRTQASVPDNSHTQPKEKQSKTPTPEAKCSGNGTTPPPVATAKAAHYSISCPADEHNQPNDRVPMMHSIAEDEEMPAVTDTMEADDPQVDTAADTDLTVTGTAGNAVNTRTHNQQAPNDPNQGADEKQTTHSKSIQEPTTDDDVPKAHQNETMANKFPKEEDSMDEEVTPVREVDPKEWRQLHDEWLHAAMQASMGNPSLLSIPDLDNVERIERKPPATNMHLQPARLVIKRYDL